MEEKEIYRCSICGRGYKTPLDRGKCEIDCWAKQKAEEERREKIKLLEERKDRKDYIDKAISEIKGLVLELNEKIDGFNVDYDENMSKINLCRVFVFDKDDGSTTLSRFFSGMGAVLFSYAENPRKYNRGGYLQGGV